MKVEALRQRLWSGVTAEEIEMVLWFGCGLNVSPKGSYWDLGLGAVLGGGVELLRSEA